MYGLAQAGRIAHLDLVKHLKPFGYFPSKWTPGLWFHKTKPITFTLVVDDFGIKYIKKEHIEHLLKEVEEQYPIKLDWTGSKYLGMNLKWDYENKTVIVGMKGYNEKELKKAEHIKPNKPVDEPTCYTCPEYGKKIQYTDDNTSPFCFCKNIKQIQNLAVKFL